MASIYHHHRASGSLFYT